MTTDLDHPTEFELLLESYPNLNKQVTIEHDGVELGTVSVSFAAKNTDDDDSQVARLYDAIILELISLTNLYLKSDIRLALKQSEIIDKKSILPYLALVSFYVDEDRFTEMSSGFGLTDDDAFRFIESEGPLALRTSGLQDKLNEWVFDPNNSKAKLINFQKRLLDYGGTKTRPGRTPSDLIDKFGVEWIPSMYEDIRYILKSVKRKYKAGESKDLESLMDEEFIDVISKRIDMQDNSSSPEGYSMKKAALRMYESENITNPLTDILKRELKGKFESPKWTPYLLAEKILADFLEVSQDTIKKHI